MKTLMTLLVLLLTGANGFAYNFTGDFNKGFYWRSFPISFGVVGSNQTEGRELLGFVQSAINNWENEVRQNVWQVSQNIQIGGQGEGNIIRWSYAFSEETGFDSASTLAITVRHSKGTFIEKTVIILNGENENLRNNRNDLLWTTLLHEIGHTVGLDHSESFYPVMATYANNTKSLQNDDIEGMTAVFNETLYRQQTGYVSPHASTESEESNLLGACGSVTDVSKRVNRGVNFLISLFVGIISIVFCLGFLQFMARSFRFRLT